MVRVIMEGSHESFFGLGVFFGLRFFPKTFQKHNSHKYL